MKRGCGIGQRQRHGQEGGGGAHAVEQESDDRLVQVGASCLGRACGDIWLEYGSSNGRHTGMLRRGRPHLPRARDAGSAPSVAHSVGAGHAGGASAPAPHGTDAATAATRLEMAIDAAPGTTNAEPLSAEEIVALSKQYTLYEWVAQDVADPIPVATAKGCYFYTADGRRFLDFNSQSMSVNIGHGDQRVIDAIAGQAQRLAFTSPFHGPRAARPTGTQAGRADARGPGRRLLHQRRCRRQRERHQAGPPGHGPPQGPGPLPLLPRRHGRGHRGHRRPAPLGRRRPASPASCAPRTSTAGDARSRSPSSEPSRSSRTSSCTKAATPSPPSSSSPSWAPTASSSRPTATCRACARSATATASCSSPTRS